MTQPVILQGIDATNYLLRYLIDPIAAVRRAYAEFGPFAVLRSPFRFVRFQKTVVALAVGAEFNRQVLSDTALWRTAHVGPGGPRNSASRRMSRGIFRMQGREHEHHRRLLLPPLRRKNIDARDSDLAKLVQDEVKTWPLGKPIDLWQLSRRMLQVLSIGLLFGNDRARGLPIAQMNYRWLRSTWSKGVNLCPLNIPGTPFHRMLSTAEALEREVLAWVACGAHDSGTNNFLSILATSPDETGCKPPPLETRNAACRKHRQRAAARQPAERLTPSSRAELSFASAPWPAHENPSIATIGDHCKQVDRHPCDIGPYRSHDDLKYHAINQAGGVVRHYNQRPARRDGILGTTSHLDAQA
jgi:cytochrome P450